MAFDSFIPHVARFPVPRLVVGGAGDHDHDLPECTCGPGGQPRRGAYASFLVQTVGARDWSAQEVGHVAFGQKTCISSRNFDYTTLTGQRAVLPGLKERRYDENATSANKLDLYLRRLEFVTHLKKETTNSRASKLLTIEFTTPRGGSQIRRTAFPHLIGGWR